MVKQQKLDIAEKSSLSEDEYMSFLGTSRKLLENHALYLAESEGEESLELAHLIPSVPETVMAIYVSINDAVCNKGLVTPFLPRHGHNNVFAFDPEAYAGGGDVPYGTVDVRETLNGFQPPNKTWDSDWTYVMVADTGISYESLWIKRGYIDMIPAKFEDFTMLSSMEESKACIFIDAEAFEHPVNQKRPYLKQARDRGQEMADEFAIPSALEGEFDGLEPVILNRGEKLYVARTDYAPCQHGWTNLHPDNKQYAVVNENSAVPLDLVIAKPQVKDIYARTLRSPRGSADLTTDWFYRGREVLRKPIIAGQNEG
jgi:hypothetical protein